MLFCSFVKEYGWEWKGEKEIIGNGSVVGIKVIVIVYFLFFWFYKYVYLECWLGEDMFILLFGCIVCYDIYFMLEIVRYGSSFNIYMK